MGLLLQSSVSPEIEVMTMHLCIKCCVEKSENEFTPRNGKLPNICRSCQSESRMKRKRENGAKTREQQREYMRQYRVNNKDHLLEHERNKRKAFPLAALWKKISSRERLLNITREEFMEMSVPDFCPMLGIPITYDLTRDNIPSVDRIDPNRPYEIGNIVIVSYRANMVKSIGSSNEHKLIADWMARNGNPPAKEIGGNPLGIGPIYLKFGRSRERV